MTDAEHEFMNAHFPFKHGDLVIEKSVAVAVIGEIRALGKRTRYSGGGIPMGVSVGERVLKQCHGGLQGFYQVFERDAERRGIISLHPTHAVMSYEGFVSAVVEAQNKSPAEWGAWADDLHIVRTAIREHLAEK